MKQLYLHVLKINKYSIQFNSYPAQGINWFSEKRCGSLRPLLFAG